MPELKAIFTGDSKPFQRELQTMEALASKAGKNMDRALAGPTVSHGSSGIIRELVVVSRELSSGNFTRLPGSLSILLQRMGLLKLIFKDGAGAATALANGYAELAQKSSLAAVAATQKAAASQLAFTADAENTEATLAAAVADEEGAAAARVNAAAMMQKAEAAQAAATAEAATAKATVGAVGIIGGVLAGLAVGAFAAYKLSSALVDKLSGFKMPDFVPEYIPKHLKQVNQAAEGWKQIRNEIERTVDSYHSVEAAANRVAEATKTHFEHVKKIADYQKEAELAKAHSPAQKEAIERKYAEEELKRDQAQRQTELSQKNTEAANLEIQGTAKKRQADAISVLPKGSDANIIARNKGQMEAAEKAYKDLQEANGDGTIGSGAGERILRGYNAVSDSGVSTTDINEAEKKLQLDATKYRIAYQDSIDKAAANDELRKRKEELTKGAGQSLSKAAQLRLDAGDTEAINAQKDADDKKELDAKLAAEKAKDSKQERLSSGATDRNKIGFGAIQNEAITIAKSSNQHLKNIDAKLSNVGKGGIGGVKF